MLTISDNAAITNATGGSGKRGGNGIFGTAMKILSGTIGTAKGGEGKTSGGHGIYGVGQLTISDNATITNATGGNADNGTGGSGIYSDGKLTIDSATITNATGGTSTNGTGGSGIHGDGSSDDFKLYIYSATIQNAGARRCEIRVQHLLFTSFHAQTIRLCRKPRQAGTGNKMITIPN